MITQQTEEKLHSILDDFEKGYMVEESAYNMIVKLFKKEQTKDEETERRKSYS